jgi:hypothetical protein
MSDHKQPSWANEATGQTGVSMTKGGQRIALEDEARARHLDLELLKGRTKTKRAQANVRMALHRKRLVAA